MARLIILFIIAVILVGLARTEAPRRGMREECKQYHRDHPVGPATFGCITY